MEITAEGYIVLLENMPTTTHSVYRPNADDTYTIILNARDTRERNMEAYRHEVEHIRRGDEQDTRTADEIEAERHRA